jgi:hypothetical protein
MLKSHCQPRTLGREPRASRSISYDNWLYRAVTVLCLAVMAFGGLFIASGTQPSPAPPQIQLTSAPTPADHSPALPSQPIEQIRPGRWVASENPEDEAAEASADELWVDTLDELTLAMLEVAWVEANPPSWHEVPVDEVSSVAFRFKTDSFGKIVEVEGPDEIEKQILGTKYVVDDLDATDVTPALWRSVELSMSKPDRSTATISALRPLWWLGDARPGDTIDLAVHEAGLEGHARILGIGDCNSDSRNAPDGGGLVIGTIHHHNSVVWDLSFGGATPVSLGVTANHPLWSIERSEWIPAGDLSVGEEVQTLTGAAAVLAKRQRPGLHTVYNLEVHRSHAYMVSTGGILAHNTGFLCGPEAAAQLATRLGLQVKVVDFVQNTKRIASLSGKKAYRVPDGLTETILLEKKNVRYQHFSSQLQDYLHFSIQTNRDMVLVVRRNTKLSHELVQVIEKGWIQLGYIK